MERRTFIKNAGRLDYCKAVAKKCKLNKEIFYIPGKGR
jgi:hypothetical protein